MPEFFGMINILIHVFRLNIELPECVFYANAPAVKFKVAKGEIALFVLSNDDYFHIIGVVLVCSFVAFVYWEFPCSGLHVLLG